uniref:Uncharacterized protein n=1 Tax=Ciona savignyi TaxID=51511 RepID=H2YIV4_CIOSA
MESFYEQTQLEESPNNKDDDVDLESLIQQIDSGNEESYQT